MPTREEDPEEIRETPARTRSYASVDTIVHVSDHGLEDLEPVQLYNSVDIVDDRMLRRGPEELFVWYLYFTSFVSSEENIIPSANTVRYRSI